MLPQQNQAPGVNTQNLSSFFNEGTALGRVGEDSLAPPQPSYPVPQKTIRPITIEQLNHGYVVKVGCQTFAIESATHLISKLEAYITNPAKTEQKWQEGVLF